MNDHIVAINIGTSQIQIAVGKINHDELEVVAYSKYPNTGMSRGEIMNIQRNTDALKITINDIEDILEDFKITHAYANLSGYKIRVAKENKSSLRPKPDTTITSSELDDIESELLKGKYGESEKVYYISPQSFTLDDYNNVGYLDIEGMTGKNFNSYYKLFIGPSKYHTFSNSILKRNNISPDKIFLGATATASAILTDDDKELGVALIDLGAGTTDLSIYHTHTLRHLSIIPFGGDSITRDIQQICKVGTKRAEEIKIHYGSCISKYSQGSKSIMISNDKNNTINLKLLSEVVEARTLEILATIKKEIEKSGYAHKLMGGVILTGGGANLAGIKTLAQKVLGMDVRVLGANNEVITKSKINEIYDIEASSVAGILIEALKDKKRQVSIRSTSNDGTKAKLNLFGDELEPQNGSSTTEKLKKSFSDLFGKIDNEA